MAETFFQAFYAFAFSAALLLVYVILPLTICYYLYKRKFMTERVRYIFASVLAFNVALLIFLVVLDLTG